GATPGTAASSSRVWAVMSRVRRGRSTLSSAGDHGGVASSGARGVGGVAPTYGRPKSPAIPTRAGRGFDVSATTIPTRVGRGYAPDGSRRNAQPPPHRGHKPRPRRSRPRHPRRAVGRGYVPDGSGAIPTLAASGP